MLYLPGLTRPGRQNLGGDSTESFPMHGNPQQPQQGYPQPYPQTVIVQKKGGGCLKAVLIGAAVLMGLIVLGTIIGNGHSGGTETTVASAPDEKSTDKKAADDDATDTESADEPKPARIGDVVKDGKFAFKVTRVEKGLSQVGEGFMVSKAQGQYVMVHLTVKNIGDEAQMFTDSAQKLIDGKGRQFDADSGAAALGLKDSNAFLNNINPGNAVNGILLFDLPKNVTLKAVELHDSMFSDGVTVSLAR
ncbi:DUF4352 domain-containing protein [Planotetraspora sp. A-T 1434]|uniref:DUF4352 domain-containing protein n=1 Tax=Planotetraspora sp. A-T 1434 TaxID=2979219 RepID=UPI0021BE43B0|nr:DUF4352 domain-containing protein [Planotetraspora sp. A-T 1434]MCT9934548.1 DUF4352 domain-containing protein [Planotetraspora sp. A-T 1434]